MKKLPEYRNIIIDDIPMVDLHVHTSWTDGVNTVSEMYDQAVFVNLGVILFSEHVRKTSADWFREFVKEVRDLPDKSCQALVGMETKIMDHNGNLDCTSEMISQCDLVVGSVHSFPSFGSIKECVKSLPGEEAVRIEHELACLILENDNVDIIGHPFGMCYRHFNVQPDEALMRSLIEKAGKENKTFEINGHYHDDPWMLIGLCMEYGTSMSLGSDAHRTGDVGKIVRLLKKGND